MRKSPLEEATLVKPFNEFEKSSKNHLRGPEAYPLLEIQSGPKQGTWFTLTHQKEISIGRANVNSIVLEDNSVSRSHSVIHEVDGKYFVKDVGSRNGTFVNEKKIQEDFLLKHGDRIKVGIYVLKFLAEPEEETAAPEEIPEEETVMDEALELLAEKRAQEAAAAKEAATAEAPAEENAANPIEAPVEKASETAPEAPLPAVVAAPAVKKEKRGLKNFAYFLVALIIIGGVGYTVYRFYIKKKILVATKGTKTTVTKTTPAVPPAAPPTAPVAQPPAVPPVAQPPTAPVEQPPTAPVATQPPAAPTAPAAPAVAGTPVILDVDAQPLQAKIFYQGKEMGMTPFKTNVSVPLGNPQEITAVYHFEELNQDFSEKKTFTVSKQDEIATVRFEGTVGSLQIKSLPKDTQVYLEGTFASNQLKSQAVKLGEIVYTRPIYLPFGNYTMEIKRPEKLEGSDTVVDVVKYRREFVISKEAPVVPLTLTEKDMTAFPAKITSNPTGADILVDGKKVGQTPYDGPLPLGKHKLTLKKDGFYEHEQPLTMTMNTPFASDVTLKTSEAGQYINKGRELMRQGQFQPAIDQFAESLKHNPSPTELAQVQILLGQCSTKTGANDVAIAYFEKAKQVEGYKGQADLGIAEASFNSGNKDVALSRVIDVMLNEKDEKVKSDAETLFRKISPLKSVILVSTDPPGAKVTINGQDVAQPTPLVLSDLGFGSYRLTIDKDGFKHYEGRFQLAISTFKPVIVKLEPGQ
ncbi:MAG: PEGA domain-containing protein [bacterium]